MKTKWILILGLVLAASPSWANADAAEKKMGDFELGVALGYPTGIGVVLGAHEISGTPLMIRGSLSTALFAATGSLTVGVDLDREGDFQQWVGVNGGHMVFEGFSLVGDLHGSLSYVGPQYGVLLWKFLSLSVGAAYCGGQYVGDNSTFVRIFGTPAEVERGTFHGFIPTANIGVSWFF